MQNEVIKIGNASFLSQTDKTLIKRILNSDFEINDDWSGNRSKLTFDSSSESVLVEDGMQVISNVVDASISVVKIYMAKYRKGSCSWDDVIYYGILDEYESVDLDKWIFLYANEQYCVYRIFSYTLPITLPFDGAYPPVSNAPFIKYEYFSNIWQRRQCQFKYDALVVSLVDSPGTDEWILVNAGDSECSFSYTKSTPFGCNFNVPSVLDINIPDECDCTDESSSMSSSSSQSTLLNSSESSESSISSQSTESSSLNSSSSEMRMAPKNIDTLYLRLVGDPFVGSQFVLELVDPETDPLVWQANSHDIGTLTTGDISLYLNSSGRFLLSANLVVNGSVVVITDALLSNIRNENFAYYSSYLKGLATIGSEYITTKYTSDAGVQTISYDCIISYESLLKSTGADKKLNEIIYDYEMVELTVDDDSEKVNLYLNKSNILNDNSNDTCRAWGLFCLDYISEGIWEYTTDEQEIRLSKTSGGNWTLYRKYKNSFTDIQEIEMQIDAKTITSNITGEYDGFVGTVIIPRYSITGGVETASNNDVCNDKDSVLVFYSSENCTKNINYVPYNGNLALTVSGGDWPGKTSYILSPNVISGNLSVWNWSSGSKTDDFEYGVLFSQDGVLWKLMLFKLLGTSRNYLFAEFIKENLNVNNFVPVFYKVHKSLISLDGEWASKEATITISGIGNENE